MEVQIVKKSRISSFLVVLLLVFQMISPIGTALAADTGVLLPPSNLIYQASTPDDGKLSWSSVTAATGYNIYEIKDGQLILLGTTKNSYYPLNNLAEGKYSYVVSTLSTDGESGPCAPIEVNITYPVMAAPSALTNTIMNGNDVVLSWGASQYAESYKVYEVGQDGIKNLLTTTANVRTYTVVNTSEGNHSYEVSAVNSLYGESAVSQKVDVNVIYPVIKAPGGLTLSLTNGNDVTLKWPAASYATSYKIYQVNSDGQEVLKTTVNTTTETLTNLSAGDYTFKVYSSSDRFGTSSEGSQNSITVSSLAMAPPANAAAKVQNLNDIAINWDSSAYAESYKVYQLVDGQRVLKNTVTGNSTKFTNMPAGNYNYEITSFSSRFGESETGSRISVTLDPVIIQKPTGLKYGIQNGNDIALTWDKADNAETYKIYQIVNGQKVLKTTIAGTNLTFSNMPAGDYSYLVYSYNSRFGESAEGSSVIFSLVHPVMDFPANTISEITGPTSFALKWDSVPYATTYKVYQVVNGTKTLKSNISTTSVNFSNMAPGNYDYEVHSYSSRFGESKDGSLVSVSLSGQAMGTPGNFTQTILNGNDIKLTWSPVPYATTYKVYKVIDGLKLLLNNVSGNTITYANQPEGDYDYQVTAFYSLFGESPVPADVQFSLVYPEMQKPEGLKATISSISDITLSWTAAQYATGYNVYELNNGQEVFQRKVTSTSTTFSKVTEGTHTYIVRSISSRFGESVEGTGADASVTFPVLLAPTGLTSSIANGNDIVLRWTAAAYATSYNIYKIVDGQKVFVKSVTGTNASLTNMPEGNYQFFVTTVSDRFGESADGAKVSQTVVFPSMQPPTTMTKNIVNGNDISLTWSPSLYATAYKVYRVAEDGSKTLVKTATAASALFTNMPEENYTYEVHSYSDRFGESLDGTSTSFTLVFPIMQAPDLSHSIANGNDIVLRWSASTYATAYKIYQVINGQKVLQKTVTGTSNTFINMPEGDYTYEIDSYSDRFGESPAGDIKTFNLTWPVVQPPVLQGSIFNANNVTLKWNSVSWANEYRVYEIKGDTKVQLYKGSALTSNFYNLTEETHNYQITAYSTRFGESILSNVVTEEIIYPEMQPPTASVIVTSPTSARISWNFVTYANGYNVYENIAGIPFLWVKNLNNLSFTAVNLSYSNHEFYVTSYSNSFGESHPSNTVIARLITDTEAPVTTTDVTDSWTGSSQTVKLTATDNDTGVAKTYYSMNDAPFVEGNSISVLNEGINKLSFYSTDKAGNSEDVRTVNVKIDKTPPETKADASVTWIKDNVDVTLLASDKQSGIAKTYYSVNGSDFKEGTSIIVDQEGINNISFYSVDQAGNKEDAKTIEVKVDKTAPVTKSEVPTAWQKDDVTVKLSATDSQSGAAKTYYSVNGSDYAEGTSFTVNEEGVNQVSYYSVDLAGNKEDAKTIEVKVDKTAPVTKSETPTAWQKDDVTVKLSAADSQSGAAKTYYSVNGSDYAEGTSFTVNEEGVNQVSYYSVDQAGNKEDAKTIEVKVDKTSPETKTDAPTSWVKDDVTVNLSATDNQSGIAKTYYSVNGSDYVEGNTFTVNEEGVNQVSFYSIDQAENKEAAKTIEVKVDKTSPETKADAPTVWVKDNVTVNLSATDNQSGIEKTYYSVNGSDYLEGTSFTVDGEGVNQVFFYSIDQAGNIEDVKTVTVRIDKSVPIIESYFKDLYALGSVLDLIYSSKDVVSGVSQEVVTLASPNDLIGKIVNKSNQIVLDKPGDYTITISTTDAAGNTQTLQKKFTVYIPASIEVTPNVIKGNKGVFTLRVNTPSQYSMSQFDLNTAQLNGVKALNSNNGYYNQAKQGQFKFERSDFSWKSGEQGLEFQCNLNGYLVIGYGSVKVVN